VVASRQINCTGRDGLFRCRLVTRSQGGAQWRRDAEIFLVSALILYLEVLLIRWIGTEIRIFAYLGNLVLVVCFFGVGLGCYQASHPASLTRSAVNLTLLVALIANPLRVSALDLRQLTILLTGFEDSPIWEEWSSWSGVGAAPALLIIAGLLYLLIFAFVPLGQLLGAAMQRHPHTIRAYSFNIAGSLAGVWLFNGLSWSSTPPPIWLTLAAGLLAACLLVTGQRQWAAGPVMLLAAGLTWAGGRAPAAPAGVRTVWSPYQKLVIAPLQTVSGSTVTPRGYLLEVNGTGYQLILDYSEKFVREHPHLFSRRPSGRDHYALPFQFKPVVHRLLIVGAGAGNNAAAALRYGAEQVDCVEIDPRIYELGRRLHPEKPYESPRVHMIINDARAYFKQARGRYDLIWFGWLDAHTLGSSYNNLRLDHYVYTVESFREAKALLADDGLLVVNFSAQRPWIADRLFILLREAFGHEPLAFSTHLQFPKAGLVPTVTYVCSPTPVDLDTIADESVRHHLRAHRFTAPPGTRPTTDDWPYLYLERPKIPKLHLLTTVTILGAVAIARQRALGLRTGLDGHFFALGAAFLLLEVQTVSRAMLLFGMTWVVNAIVISAVLVMILLANLVAARWPRLPQWSIVAGLAATIGALASVPLDWFNALPGAGKLVAASVFLTGPVFFAGLIFIRSFAACADRSRALGSNLIGALVGGLLESVSFLTGLRALVGLVGLLYAVALWLRPGPPRPETAA